MRGGSSPITLVTPLRLEPVRTVAPEIALVGPERAVLVEVLRGEEVDGERLDPRRHRAVPGGADERRRAAWARLLERADQPVLLGIPLDLGRRKRLDVVGNHPCLRRDGRRHRRAAAHALECGRGGRRPGRRARHRRGRDQRGKCPGRALPPSLFRHSSSPLARHHRAPGGSRRDIAARSAPR